MKNKYKILLISCAVVLLICFAIKMLGGNLFEIMVENQKFINACNWLDGSWVKFLITTPMYFLSTYIPYLCMIDKKFGQELWISFFVLPASLLKVYFPYAGLVLDIIVMILIPLCMCEFSNWKKVIVINVLMIGFQAISLLTKNIGFYMPSDSLIVSLIFSIDYYIMIILFYLWYNGRKEKQL